MQTLTMRAGRSALAGALVIALGAGVLAQKIQINGAGATFPEPIYYQVVLGVQQAAPDGADQLPAARVGRRHQAAHRARRCSSAPPTGR